MWYSLKVGDNVFRIKRIQAVKPKFADVDENGNSISKVCKQKGIYVWVDKENNEVMNRYKLINGKVMSSLTRTKETSNFKEVESSEAFDLLPEQVFYVDRNEALLNRLQEKNKALLFGYTTSGFEGGFYRAYIVAEKGELMMYCGNEYKSKAIAEAKAEQSTKVKSKATIKGVERAKADDLIKL